MAISLASKNYVFASLAVSLGFTGMHLIFFRLPKEYWFVLGVAGFGFLLDSIFFSLGFIYAPRSLSHHPLPPIWLFGIWALFSSTLLHSLYWLQKNRWAANILGGVFGPLTYFFAGAHFDLLHFRKPLLISLGIYCLGWILMMELIRCCILKFFKPRNKGTIQ